MLDEAQRSSFALNRQASRSESRFGRSAHDVATGRDVVERSIDQDADATSRHHG
ncbi:MAG: hypothetical protein IAE78_03245 [Myxococcus sp.]|nr:hypothetical protein [Myxococcus sp.]